MDGYDFVPETGGWAPKPAADTRPSGPWDDNFSVAPTVVKPICPWCDDFDPTDEANRGASHKICTGCMTKALKGRRS